MDDSVIVRFRKQPTMTMAKSSMSQVNGFIEDKNKDGVYDQFSQIAGGELALVQLDKTMSVEEALEILRKDPNVAYAEPNYKVHLLATPNDMRFNELWGMNNTGQTGGTADADIDAVEAWDNSVGSTDVVVGVVDTGIDYNHQDLAANSWVNPNEIPGNGVDDDGNGVIDDVHGYNAITNTGDPLDDHDHGSHCSGTIGAVGNNGVGVAGVNWDVQIMGIKFLNSGGSGSTAGAIASINYAVAQRNAGINLRVLSNSWGGGGFSQALMDAITAAYNVDILFVAAAGNAASNNDTTPNFPSNYDVPNVLAVAATDHNDALASFSNFGATTVDVGAPGVSVLSTTRNNTYQLFSGTSMATPHTSGVAALVLSQNDTFTVEELKDVIMTSGDLKPSLAGITVSGRRINAANALDDAGPPIPRFNMALDPPAQVIAQGDSTSYSVDITSVAGFTGDVALTLVSDPPLNATATFTPPTVTAPGGSTLNIATTMATTPGFYNLTVTGTSGALIKSRTVSLRVRPFGTVRRDFPSTDTPISIPDNNPTGITSTIIVNEPLVIDEVEVNVNITHTFIGDLLVSLRSPAGTTVILHNRAGGSADNIHQTYVLPTQFIGQMSQGAWVLHVDDNAAIDAGTLDSWTLSIIGVPGAADFGVSASPTSHDIRQTETATSTINVEAFGGFNGNVALTATSNPPMNASITFTPSSVAAPGTATMDIATSTATATGDYVVTVTGSSGGVTHTTDVAVHVRDACSGSTTVSFNGPPIPIPDNNATGIVSTLNIPDDINIEDLSVHVDITHTFIGDLVVQLVSPAGTLVALHNRTGGSADNIHQTYTPTQFDGQNTAGAWQLRVQDRAGIDIGTLDSWSLTVSGSSNCAPVADFTYNQNFLAFDFIDRSSDLNGSVVSWAWDFGDGNTSTAQNPSHTYAVEGDYTVTLTVTDDLGATGSTSQTVAARRQPPLLWIEGVVRDRTRFEFQVTLGWMGADGFLVELFRNGELADIPDNDGLTTDTFRRYETTYTWYLCEQFTTFCSNEVSIVFGASEDQVKVITKIDGKETVEMMNIIDAN